MRTSTFLYIGLVLAAACGREQTEAGEVMQEAGGVLMPDSLLAEGPVPRPGEPVDLFNPTDIALAGEAVVVVDNGNDRLVLMDRQLNVVSVVGRRGGGPGEFNGPLLARPYGEGIAVLDPGNARFTLLGADGTYRDVVPAQVGYMPFASASSGEFYIPARSRTAYLQRLQRGETTSFAARLDTGAVADSMRYSLGAQDPFVAVSAGDTVHVLDGSSGVLHKYAPNGEHVQSRSIPVTLADTLLRRSADIAASFRQGDQYVSVPFVKAFTVSRGGSLLLLIAGSSRTCALLIDPANYGVRRIVLPDTRPEWQPLCTAAGAWLAEPVLYVVSQESVYAYRLAERQ